MYVLVSAAILVLVVAALIDIITRHDSQVKYLPKLVWILLVVLLPLVGSILWFVIGREYGAVIDRGSFGDPRRRETVPSARAGNDQRSAKTTEEQLAELEREFQLHKEQVLIRRLEAKLNERNKRAE